MLYFGASTVRRVSIMYISFVALDACIRDPEANAGREHGTVETKRSITPNHWTT